MTEVGFRIDRSWASITEAQLELGIELTELTEVTERVDGEMHEKQRDARREHGTDEKVPPKPETRDEPRHERVDGGSSDRSYVYFGTKNFGGEGDLWSEARLTGKALSCCLSLVSLIVRSE